MIPRRIIFRPALGIALVIFLCLAVLAGRSDANVLKLIIPAVLVKKHWRSPQLIETNDTEDAGYAQIAIDAAGNAVAVWSQWDGICESIWTNYYKAHSGWGTAQLLETDDTGLAVLPQVAIDTAGNAIAVWQQSDGTHSNVWARRYDAAGGSWEAAQLLETSDAGAGYPQIAFDVSGNALAVWAQSDGSHDSIWAARYAAGSWGAAQLVETDDTGYASWPQIAMNAEGNAVAVWRQWDGSHYSIWTACYTSGSWGAAQLLETDDANDAEQQQVAIDAAGNAVAVWRQHDGTVFHVWAARYDAASSSWGEAQPLETNDTDDAWYPQIALDAAGNAVAVWHQQDIDGSVVSVWNNRYTAGSGWGGAQPLDTSDTDDAGLVQIEFDATGNAIAVWIQWDGIRFNIWARHYTAGSGWGTAKLIETDNAGDALYPQIAVNATGDALAVWHQSDGIRDSVWAAWYK